MQNDHNLITLHEKNLMSSSSQDPISSGRPFALCSMNHETFSDGEGFPVRNHQQVLGAMNLSFDSVIQ